MSLKYTCPSCGFIMFEEGPGSYDICKICGWEDDDVQLKYCTLRGGANKISLYESQLRILKIHPIEIREYQNYKRDPKWRPLNEEDLSKVPADIKTGLDYFNASGKGPYKYYWDSGKN